jgi:hypothetical protein
MSGTTENLAGATAIRPFRIEVPEEDLVELRRRMAATRWPSKELVADRSQWEEPQLFSSEVRAAFRPLR